MAKDPYRFFRVEARELMDQLTKAALDLEKRTAGAEQVSSLLRLAHTLKGAARVVKQRDIADLAHIVEETLAPYRADGQPVEREQIDSLLDSLDAISVRLAQLPGPEGGETTAPSAEVARTVRAEVADVDDLLQSLAEVHAELAAIRRALDEVKRGRHLAALLTEQLAPARAGEASRSTRQAGASLDKVRALAEQLSEGIAGFERSVAACTEHADRELGQACELTERLRLVPAGGAFNALERVARDAAHSGGKRVSFAASGGDVRLEGHVLDAVQSALAQIVRNAVVHGIESEAERREAGKPPEGCVRLEVTRRAHHVLFRCRDDGRGVDLEAVRRSLARKGGLPDGAEQLGSAELLRVLLKGGLTTSNSVTELSGRGIGLDVVREVAARLGGEVSVQTAAGSGTTLELRVPVSLASLDALIVEAGGEAAAIPLDAIRTTLRIAPHLVTHGPEGDAIVHQGNLIPLFPLASCLSHDGIDFAKARNGQPVSAVVVAGTNAVAAVAVDRLRGTKTIMLRPLPALTPVAAVVSGTYVDTEGNPRPVLDPEALVNRLRLPLTAKPAAAVAPLPILVIDDSLTTRMLEQSILESAGYQVELASSADEALDMARGKPFGLFLVDVEMPGMDGFTFIERSRADPLLRNVQCILVTSRESAEDRKRGQAAGACAYIVKGEFDQIDFLDRIARLVQQ
jgi:two-component system chemotaxis sensor kinase CheA